MKMAARKAGVRWSHIKSKHIKCTLTLLTHHHLLDQDREDILAVTDVFDRQHGVGANHSVSQEHAADILLILSKAPKCRVGF